ncbi:histone-like nucleoid-structuring protein Lsr2 [Brevibacterium casei]|uniref:histone-like nucleoid-structuring protein Lsr2 n=1 Tax=Brevibacterium casei TaxID=33889 RepID=UPI003F8038C4
MAKRVITILESDLSGQETEDVETVSFGWNGRDLEIDLTERERNEFEKAISKYVDHARRADRGVGRRRSPRTDTGSGLPSEELAQARAWLQAQGETVADRGRIKAELIERWEAAGKPSA